VATLDTTKVATAIRTELAVWRQALTCDIPVARQILSKLLNERLVLTPNGAPFAEEPAPAILKGVTSELVKPIRYEPLPGAKRHYTPSPSVNFGSILHRIRVQKQPSRGPSLDTARHAARPSTETPTPSRRNHLGTAPRSSRRRVRAPRVAAVNATAVQASGHNRLTARASGGINAGRRRDAR